MYAHSSSLILPLFLFSHYALGLFEPRAVDLSIPNSPAAILPEHRNYGLFDRPEPIPITITTTTQQQDATKNRRDDSIVSADPVPTTAAMDAAATDADPVPLTTDPAMTMTTPPPPLTSTAAVPVPTDFTYATNTDDTYLLPSAYDGAQLSSLFAAESSFVSEASTLLSAFPMSESGVACTGVSDVSGAVVTVCGPTGDPRSSSTTGTVGNAAGNLKDRGLVGWVCVGLGIVGGGVVFFL